MTYAALLVSLLLGCAALRVIFGLIQDMRRFEREMAYWKATHAARPDDPDAPVVRLPRIR